MSVPEPERTITLLMLTLIAAALVTFPVIGYVEYGFVGAILFFASIAWIPGWFLIWKWKDSQ